MVNLVRKTYFSLRGGFPGGRETKNQAIETVDKRKIGNVF